MKKAVVLVLALVSLLIGGILVLRGYGDGRRGGSGPQSMIPRSISSVLNPTPVATATPTEVPLPLSKILLSDYQTFQSFNNCGPASLSMALRYYGIVKSQEEIGNTLRPWQIASGDNDDKSVTLEEMGKYAEELGFTVIHRPMGTIQLLKKFIANDMPVVTRTWLHPNEDIGHYRVVNGYDDTSGTVIQQDSFEGKDLRYTYGVFNDIWKKYNYEYLVLVPKGKEDSANAIVGADRDPQNAWRSALTNSQNQLAADPNDIYARFNASVAYYHLNDYVNSVKEFEQVESLLPFRTLWYQIEPIQAYEKLENYDRVFAITTSILSNHNRAFSELYIIRGDIYKKQGNIDLARAEYQNAVTYNVNLKAARDALRSVQ